MWIWLAGCVGEETAGAAETAGGKDAVEDSAPIESGGTGESGSIESGGADACAGLDLAAVPVEVDAACDGREAVATIEATEEWSRTDPGDVVTSPVVSRLVDSDEDGVIGLSDTPVIVVGDTGGMYWAMDGATGRVLWNTAESVGFYPSTAALGDLDGDGWPDVVAWGLSWLMAWRGRDGALIWAIDAPMQGAVATAFGAPAVEDLDGDGVGEVILGRMILEGRDGSLRGEGSEGCGALFDDQDPFGYAADLDVDGQLEVLVGNAAYDPWGALLWSNGELDGAVAVGQFDADDAGEMVVSSWSTIRLQDDDGTVLWQADPTPDGCGGAPTLADVDGDGGLEIAYVGTDAIYLLDADGTLLWQNAVHDRGCGYSAVAAFDFEGDGAAELVYADEDDLWVFDGASGVPKLKDPAHSLVTYAQSPVVADVDADGEAEIVDVNAQLYGTERGVRVLGSVDGSWMPASPVWNQHAWSVTHVEEDGSLPGYAEPAWLDGGGFRAAPTGLGSAVPAADAEPQVLDTCTEACADGEIVLSVAVANTGTGPLPAGVEIVVEVLQGGSPTRAWSGVTGAEVAAGTTSPGFEVRLDAASLVDGVVRVRVDPDDAMAECAEDDNGLDLAILCP